MRITGGSLRGRMLFAPPDARVRPTSDKVRQAIFNILAHNDFAAGFSLAGARVADLFAGTGAMGIEAISRGARFCLFVDESADSRALIRKNIEALQMTGVSKVWRRDATQLGPMPTGSGGPFDLAFIDPPYRQGLVAASLASVACGWLAEHAILVIETAEAEQPELPHQFAILDERTYGDTTLKFLRAT